MNRQQLKKRNERIYFAFSMGKDDTEIGRAEDLTPGRVHQLRDKWRAEKDKESHFPYYHVEFLDHSMTKGIEQKSPSELAIVGQLVKETKDAYYFRQTWSKTLAKDINSVIVIKSTIKTMNLLVERIKKEKVD